MSQEHPKILQDNPLLSTRQAAEETGFHATHFNALLLNGKLPGTKDEKGRWQIKRSDLDNYLKSNDVKPRRPRKYTKRENQDGPPKTVSAQLEDALARIERLKSQVAQKNEEAEELNGKVENWRRKYQKTVEEYNKRIDDYVAHNSKLEKENTELKQDSKENLVFLRDLLKETMQLTYRPDSG